MYNRVLDIVENVVYVAGIVIALLTQVWWVGLFILISAVPVSIIAARAGRRSYEADREMSKVDRRANYISNVLKSREAFEERGIYGYSDKMNELYAERYEYARKFRQKVIRRNFVRTKMGGVITSLLSIITMLAMLQPVAQGRLNLGMFIGLMGAVFGLSNRLSWGVNWLIEELVKKREFLKDLTEFMSLEEIPGANDLPREGMNFKTIKFRNVSFKYPGTDKPVLDNVSFAIENGRHYSFVGENGAGKTTITKLITGLYTNYEGEILVDNRPLRELSQSEIKGLSSVVYQDFAKYSVSMYDNIAVARLSNNSNIEQSDSGQIDNGQIDRDQFATGQIGNGQIDSNQGDRDQTDSSQIDSSQIDGNRSSRADVLYAANLVGLAPTIEKLPDGIDTPLGKVHEKGMDISGGEWQRVALARGVLSPAPLRILDEPTASLDPISESRIYSMFERISMGMTTIFISHRLGSTKLADTIYVLKDGKIVECGSHNELMERHGVYYEMFQTQAEWYAGNGSIKDMNETEVYANAYRRSGRDRIKAFS